MSLAARALATMRRHRMLDGGGRVLVALSGGADSVALLDVLRTLAARGHLVLAGAAHFNHQMRVEADLDEAFCREIAAAKGLPFEAGRGDVRAAARQRRRSIEDTARSMRYAFLEAARARLGGDVIAVAHTVDDQAETFLLRLLRGAGTAGWSGIRPRTGRVVRPLLEVTRQDLRRHLDARGLPFREDASNADVSVPRNRVRHELIPYLQGFSPNVVEVLARQAEAARRDEELLAALAIERTPGVVLRSAGRILIETGALRDLPPALASRVVRAALQELAPHAFVGFEHVERVLELAEAPGGGAQAALPGGWAAREGERILLSAAAEGERPNFAPLPLSIPGEAVLAGWTVSARAAEVATAGSYPRVARGPEVAVAAEAVRGPLAVRTRRPGDRFRPLGMGGHGRKLQDFLVDRKVPRRERDALPLVVDRDDRIVWVVGQSIAEDFRVTRPERGVILLKARQLGGAG
jgi:tRNA(Ile)-lysidine synthase